MPQSLALTLYFLAWVSHRYSSFAPASDIYVCCSHEEGFLILYRSNGTERGVATNVGAILKC